MVTIDGILFDPEEISTIEEGVPTLMSRSRRTVVSFKNGRVVTFKVPKSGFLEELHNSTSCTSCQCKAPTPEAIDKQLGKENGDE